MTSGELSKIARFFNAYLNRFVESDGRLHPMQQLKLDHSRRVTGNAVRIMRANGWDWSQCLMGAAAALTHDIGRFSQYAEFKTFNDRISFNHAERSCRILLESGALAGLSEEERAIILESVSAHNRRALPENLSPVQQEISHLVRDSDKLDIFRVFQEAIVEGHLENHPEIALSLDTRGKASPELLAAISEDRSASYENVHTLCDFALIQVGWIKTQMHYDVALAMAVERRALEFREEFICRLDDSPAVHACFAATRASIARRFAQPSVRANLSR